MVFQFYHSSSRSVFVSKCVCVCVRERERERERERREMGEEERVILDGGFEANWFSNL